MTDQISDQISAFIDDEVSDEESAFLIRRFEHDSDARSQAARYMIGAALRNEAAQARSRISPRGSPARSAAPRPAAPCASRPDGVPAPWSVAGLRRSPRRPRSLGSGRSIRTRPPPRAAPPRHRCRRARPRSRRATSCRAKSPKGLSCPSAQGVRLTNYSCTTVNTRRDSPERPCIRTWSPRARFCPRRDGAGPGRAERGTGVNPAVPRESRPAGLV